MGEQLGLQGLIIPEEYGGSGFSYVELIVVLEEMGRALLCAPVLLDGRARRQHADPLRRRRSQEGAPPRHRVGRDDRHARVHRAQRQVGRGGHRGHGHEVGRRAGRSTARRCSCSTATPPTSSSSPPRTERGRDRCSRSTATRRASPARRWPHGPDPQAGQARVRRHAGAARSAPTARAGPCCRRCSTSPRSRSPPSRSAARRGASTWRSSTPRCACSSAARSARSRRSSTSAPTCCSRSSRPSPPRTTPAWCAAEDERRAALGRQPGQGLLLRGVLPRRRREHPDPRRHRLHVGAPRPPVLQAGQVAPSCCSATRRTTASCSRSASASERPHPHRRRGDRLHHRRGRHRA